MSFDTTLPGQTDWTTLLIILGLTVVTIVSRSLFFLSSRELPMPRWFRRGLRAWLARFHVTPRDALRAELERLAEATGGALRWESLHRDYAQRAVLTRA